MTVPMRNKAMQTETPDLRRSSDVLQYVYDNLRTRIPASWTVSLDIEQKFGPFVADAMLEVSAPDGTKSVLPVEVRLGLDPREVPAVLEKLKRIIIDADTPAETKGPPLIVARYISPRTQEMLAQAGACFADSVGNVSLWLERPALYIQSEGASKNPWREERELRSLKGRPAAEVIRALCDFLPPVGIRDLAFRSGVSTGSTYRVVDFLAREALITREERGPVTEVDWKMLIMRWSKDYSFTKSNTVKTFIEPRGLQELLKKLADVSCRYAITGSLAASKVAPYADSRVAMIYVDKADEAASDLGLRSAEQGSNVMLAESFSRVAFDRAWFRDGNFYAALSQVAVDLLTSPGRGPAEADELFGWMEQNQSEWRT